MKDLTNQSSYFNSKDFVLYKGNSIDLLKEFDDNTFDLIFADPPYFLSNNGITCSSGKMVSVNKGQWDKANSIEEIHNFNKAWLKESQRILKDNGTILISGTYHNIYSVGYALQELGFKILNNITWAKSNPPPNLACRYFTHSSETIIWAGKNSNSKHYFDYELMKSINNNKQMKDVWNIPCINIKEKNYGAHPTQKPIRLMERLIIATSKKNALVLDPFNGSGTTGIACYKHNRKYVGIDLSKEYLDITIKRYKAESSQLRMNI